MLVAYTDCTARRFYTAHVDWAGVSENLHEKNIQSPTRGRFASDLPRRRLPRTAARPRGAVSSIHANNRRQPTTPYCTAANWPIALPITACHSLIGCICKPAMQAQPSILTHVPPPTLLMLYAPSSSTTDFDCVACTPWKNALPLPRGAGPWKNASLSHCGHGSHRGSHVLSLCCCVFTLRMEHSSRRRHE